MKNLKILFFTIGLCLLISGCQRDDICPEGTPITPLLIIEFYDTEDPTRLLSVPNLLVQAIGEDTLLEPESVNRIAIPLRTDQSTTDYLFVRNSGTANENIDTITFSYDPAPEYLNRACGFIVNYIGLDASTHRDEDNWINSELIIETDIEIEIETEIEDETEAHIYITH